MKTTSANSPAGAEIGIYFHDDKITWLFSQLLSSLNVRNHVVANEQELASCAYVITEQKYHSFVKDKQKSILVGGDPTDKESIHLSQPLTEEKILEALQELLG